MRVLIIGGAGLIGSYIARELVERGDEVVILDALINYVSPFDKDYKISEEVLGRRWSIRELLNVRFKDTKEQIKFIRGDIRHKGRLSKILADHQPQKVINLAAIPLASESNIFSEDALSLNTIGTANILEALKEMDCVDQFIQTSSSMVYGDFQYTPCDEKHPTDPLDLYGGTKLAGEILTRVHSRQYDIPYTIIRPSAVYGPSDVNRRVSQLFLQNAVQGKKLVLHNGGKSRLDFTYVKDIAHAFVLAMDTPKAIGETFNITRGEGRSLSEYVEILRKHTPEIEVDYQELTKKEIRSERGSLDISKAKELLGYNPQYSLEDGIKEYFESYVQDENLRELD